MNSNENAQEVMEPIVANSQTEERALSLLGQGIPAESVAAALGVSPSRISQLLSQEQFAEQVAAARYANLQKHNVRDAAYDSIEDKLIDKLNKSIPLMFKPETILKAIQTINGAKRRGQSAPDQVTNQTTVVNLVLPTQITQKFVTNKDNQVVEAGEQSLITMQSGSLLKKAQAAHLTNNEEADNESQEKPALPNSRE